MPILLSGLAGLLFGIGLIVAGMANPAKVLGFLDIAGAWDPSLALVMGGAIGIGSVAFAAARRRSKSLLGSSMQWPTASGIDRRLVLGSLMFGIGWGLAGICPGPAMVLLGSSNSGSGKALVFVVAMLLGMLVFELLQRPTRTLAQHEA
ncbi:YeeE/YedE family protein [Undibacterium terreum]|uniref:YeeE/YedE family protein n=1 Tax=Undibacterium terreum TaxID=1224302 RepID=A0A916V2E2_9BURK|nr:YeeE/YedE family protein [Undibacterium terreum]GGD01506.1 hypothetical protein GCM10011396_56300 [Undibacterium terreum]